MSPDALRAWIERGEWKSISPRMVSAKLAMAESKYLHLVSVYAPTFHAPEQEKIEFYNDLQAVIDGKTLKHKETMYVTFADLRKAYDSVPRAAMWKVLQKIWHST